MKMIKYFLFSLIHDFLLKGLIILFSIIFLLFSLPIQAQSHEIKGTVKNENGEPIPFATIKVITLTAVKTIAANTQGEFAILAVPDSAVLEISSVGYEPVKTYWKGKNTPLMIILKASSTNLQEVEVVNTGYQSMSRERSTGSFVRINNSTLNQQTGTNLLQRLDGVASSLIFNIGKQNNNPQNKTNISIRGLSTISGPLDPLIVLDGFIYEGDINNIDPNDVDNVTILKDATAASIWGARAGNGVIVITTKRGKFNQKLKIGLNAAITINDKPDLFYIPQMSSADYIDVEQLLFNNRFFNGRINSGYIALTPSVEVFLSKRNGLISSEDSADKINALKAIDSRDQYNKYVYRNAVTQQYSVSMQGGTAKNAYDIAIGYNQMLGEVRNTSDRKNIKLGNMFRPAKNLQVNFEVYYTNIQSKSGLPPYGSILTNNRQIPYLRLASDDGSPLPVALGLSNSYTDTAGGGYLLNWKFVPLENYKHAITRSNMQQINSNVSLKYNFSKYINLDVQYQYQQQNLSTEQLSDKESFASRNLVNLFSQVDRSNGVVTYIIPPGGIRALDNSTIESETIRGQLNFENSWTNHAVSAIMGAEARNVKAFGENFTTYGYTEDPLSSGYVDYMNYYPMYTNGGYSTISGSPFFSNSTNRFISLYGNANYTYRRKYSVSASARKDGSNIFGASTNDKWKPLWSVGTGWKLSDEPFYNLEALPQVKLRTTFGYSGNVDLSRTALAVANYISSASSTNYPVTRIRTLNNPELRWEQVSILNFGLDFSSKKDIISGSVEYYRKKGIDLYGQTAYDYTTWGLSPTIVKNIAGITGNGVDIILNTKNFSGFFKWNTTLLFNYATDKTTKYGDESAKSINTIIGSGSGIVPQIGKPLYAIAAYKWGGLDNTGNPQGFVNGELSTDYRSIFNEGRDKGLNGNIVYIGPSSPVYFGSLINTLSYGNVSLAFNISYRLGYYFRKSSISYSSLVSSGIGHKDYAARWKNPGDENRTNVPSFVYPNNSDRDNFYLTSDINVLKADNIKLQYVNISYMLKMKGKGNLPFNGLMFYINAADLGIIWKANKENLDPDYPSSILPERKLTFGIRTDF
jgi:TonB-linked SusC/RagA family outer membrane protein